MSNENVMSAKEKIQILLKEYDTLRSEIIARTSGGYQLIGVGTLLFTAMLATLTRGYKDPAFAVSLFVFVISISIFFWFTRRDINMLARHIKKLEGRINALAEDSLLSWESRFGAAETGWVVRKQEVAAIAKNP